MEVEYMVLCGQTDPSQSPAYCVTNGEHQTQAPYARLQWRRLAVCPVMLRLRQLALQSGFKTKKH